jgi:hypothetical protein
MSLEEVDFTAFVSYAHLDDDNSNGRIHVIAQLLKGEYELQSGVTLQLFLDRDHLSWGDEWQRVISSNLEFAAFLIPFLSPTYLKRAECRREFIEFRSAAVQTGSEKYILPVLFAQLPNSRDEDEVVKIAKSLQWRDWTHMRLLDPTSEVIAIEIAAMVKQLISRAEELTTAVVAIATPSLISGGQPETEPSDDDEAPGLTDKIAEAEESLPELTATLERIGVSVAAIGEAFKEATPSLTTARSFKDRVIIMRSLAGELAPLVSDFHDHALSLDAGATKADPGIDALLDLAEETPPADDREALVGLLESIKVAADGMDGMEAAAIGSRSELEAMISYSRDLRPHIKTYLEGVDYVVSSAATIHRWGERAGVLLRPFGRHEEE